jgi:hypothetical protein
VLEGRVDRSIRPSASITARPSPLESHTWRKHASLLARAASARRRSVMSVKLSTAPSQAPSSSW